MFKFGEIIFCLGHWRVQGALEGEYFSRGTCNLWIFTRTYSDIYGELTNEVGEVRNYRLSDSKKQNPMSFLIVGDFVCEWPLPRKSIPPAPDNHSVYASDLG